jgi:hypothetical protein
MILCIDFTNGKPIFGPRCDGNQDGPNVALSHPFVERLIGTIRREYLDRTLSWTTADLEAKLFDFQHYFSGNRTHAGLKGRLLKEWQALFWQLQRRRCLPFGRSRRGQPEAGLIIGRAAAQVTDGENTEGESSYVLCGTVLPPNPRSQSEVAPDGS